MTEQTQPPQTPQTPQSPVVPGVPGDADGPAAIVPAAGMTTTQAPGTPAAVTSAGASPVGASPAGASPVGASPAGASPVAVAPAAGRRALTAAVPVIALVVLGLDQLTKYLAVAHLGGRGRVDVIGGAFGFDLIRNPGAAFSMATGTTWIFSVIAIAVAVIIIRMSRRLGHWGWAVAFGLLLGGAVGNLTDRIFRSPGVFRGHVVDFLEFPHWPIFNLADSSITCSAVLIGALSVIGIGIDGRRLTGDGRSGDAPEKAGAPEEAGARRRGTDA